MVRVDLQFKWSDWGLTFKWKHIMSEKDAQKHSPSSLSNPTQKVSN